MISSKNFVWSYLTVNWQAVTIKPAYINFYHKFVSRCFTGFTEDGRSFAVITEQAFAILEQGAPREIVETYLNSHGFVRMKNDDYYSKSMGVKLEDLHDENVFLDEEGNILFIDPVIYFETLDLKLGGELIFHFPFNQL